MSRQAHRLSHFFLMGTNHPRLPARPYAYTPIRRSVSPGGPDPTSSVPPGRRSLWTVNPAINRRATIICPSGTRSGRRLRPQALNTYKPWAGLSFLAPSGHMAGANRSWCQKVGQMSRVYQVQTTGRFEVEDSLNTHFVPGSDQPVPPGQKPFAHPSASQLS